MSYGIELKNDGGGIVIGSIYSQVYFHQKITGQIPPFQTGTGITNNLITLTTTITDSSFRPVVFYELPIGGLAYAPVRVYYSGGLWRVDVGGANDAAVTIYVFTKKDAATSGWGLQTFDVAGDTSFDSSSLPLIISGREFSNRNNDSFTDWQDVFPGQDIYGGYVEIAVDTLSIPTASQTTKVCVSVPPAFYGVGLVDSPLTIYRMSAFTRISQTQIRVGDPASPNDGGNQNTGIGTLNVNTPNGLGLGISASIWTSINVSFMDGNIYS